MEMWEEMKQSVNSLLAKHSSLQQLLSAGFLYLDELEDITPVELSKETKLSLEESLRVIEEVRKHKTNSLRVPTNPQVSTKDTLRPTNKAVPQSVSSLDLLWREQEESGIPTGSKELDEMLGEGVPLGKMTEICGVPGIGKSQLAFQLCINSCVGRGAGAVLIDTEGSFVPQRAEQMAEAVCTDLNASAGDGGSAEQGVMTSESILSRIHYFRCLDIVQLLSAVNTLDEFVAEKRAEGEFIKLVVIDSIAFPFRMELQNMRLRSRMLQTLSQSLMELTQAFGLGIVLTNQMTSRGFRNDLGGRMQLVPALGDSWAHIPTIRLVLQWNGPVRAARLTKSPTHMEKVVSYEITEKGVRDLVEKRASKRGLADSEHTSGAKTLKSS